MQHILLLFVLTTSLFAQTNYENSIEQWFNNQSKENSNKLEKSFDKNQYETIKKQLYNAYKKYAISQKWDKELEKLYSINNPTKHTLSAYGFNMPYYFVKKGTKPKNGWPMFISLHGGGGNNKVSGPHAWNVNTREWQIQLLFAQGNKYKPTGAYFIPRMADDRKGRWWHKHNQTIFERAIKLAILFHDIDPNKVHIMGISQGAYGSLHLAPHMPDLFASVGAMAGGMDARAINLRNLPTRSDTGEFDTMFKRNQLVKSFHDKLNELKKKDPEGYHNKINIQKGKGHGINYNLCPTWVAQYTRNCYPNKIAWNSYALDGLYRKRNYWIELSEPLKKGALEIFASYDKTTNSIDVKAQEITPKTKTSPKMYKKLTSTKVIVNLNDKMLDLDKKVKITFNGKQVYNKIPKRTILNMADSLKQTGDINFAFPVRITLE